MAQSVLRLTHGNNCRLVCMPNGRKNDRGIFVRSVWTKTRFFRQIQVFELSWETCMEMRGFHWEVSTTQEKCFRRPIRYRLVIHFFSSLINAEIRLLLKNSLYFLPILLASNYGFSGRIFNMGLILALWNEKWRSRSCSKYMLIFDVFLERFLSIVPVDSFGRGHSWKITTSDL